MNFPSGPVGAQDSPLPAAIPPPTGISAGWYEDPWQQAPWRWYDGHTWTRHIHGATAPVQPTATAAVAQQPQTPIAVAAAPRKPFLPSFLSWPVALCALPSIGFLGYVLYDAPAAFALGFIPLLIVMPVLLWLDRVEPEPWSAKIHTFLWGAFVAGLISVIFNTGVALAFNETVAAVASAPVVEEITKTLGIAWMVKRKEVDGPIDGIVYAGWAAMGFAMIENMSYFQFAFAEDILVEVFVGRALLTPFAHPLFTMWAGLAIGLAVRARKSPWFGLWGLVLAMALHAAWNGSLSIGETEGGAAIIFVVALLFIGLFVSSAIGLAWLRSRDTKRYLQLAPMLADRYAIDIHRVGILLDHKSRQQVRSELKDKQQRRAFTQESTAMVRLAALFDYDEMPQPQDESRLYSQLMAVTPRG